jgi:glutaminyl-peptide cyclotransferase
LLRIFEKFTKVMRQKLAYGLIAVMLLGVVFTFLQKNQSKNPKKDPENTAKPQVVQVNVPTFSADSAFRFVQKQIDFGHRVPNTPGHKQCAAWFVQEFKRRGMSVIEQKFQAKHFLGETYNGINVIAQYKPDHPKRILIGAHWDSRFQADHDDKDQKKPIDGADDGASGVAVILEIARSLAENPVDIGVDFILFDAEDQGKDGEEGGEPTDETWCLGSQHWSKNLHKPGYMPFYAVLLDMVGAKGAQFPKEASSMQVAGATVDKIWRLGNKLGYGNYFVDAAGPGIVDDHLFVIRNARIPMIDIVHMQTNGEKIFGPYHHTHDDNIQVIDKNTLKAVGQTMTAFIYGVHNETI